MMNTKIFESIELGNLELKNRLVMSPLTRCRCDEGRVPNAMMAEYYGQRASAGLILGEATSINARGVGYPDTPGLWSDKQVEGWKLVTQRVHAAGGRILLQLWHVGRISDPIYLDGALPVPPEGGLKSFGNPIGASGLRMLFEAWTQLRGEAGERQIGSIGAGKNKALTHNLGGSTGA